MQIRIQQAGLALALAFGAASAALAQTAAPAGGWTGSIGAGLAITGGNTQTTTTNLAFDLQSDAMKTNVIKADGLNIRSTRDGYAIVDRTSLQFQDNYKISPRAYGFGRLQYLRDAFKSIDYLISPTAGVGYKVLENAVSTLTADVAVGAVTEKNPGLEKRSSGAITAGEKAVHKLSTSATLTQSLAALWKMSDFGDSLVTFQAGLATDITPKTQLKVDFLDTYKNQPPSVLVKKNDTALLMSFGFKF